MKTLIKICGIKSTDEAKAVLEVGAKFGTLASVKPCINGKNTSSDMDFSEINSSKSNVLDSLSVSLENAISFIGVIFARSKRQVDIQTAREISRLAHRYGVKCVGVFASSDAKSCVSYLAQNGVQSDCEIMEICEYCELDVAQIHGTISQNLYANLKDMGLDVFKAVSVSPNAKTLPSVDEPCDMALYDCKGESLGGNGTSFGWEILRDLKPFSFGMAGGIGEQNFAQALEFKPFLIDINSKVEDENLVKVPSKIEKILQIFQGAKTLDFNRHK
ncbi:MULTISPECIES: phosphoribosylanthranilate isomerase [unclassified Campylobacter]|uniref:phosphoribosylanthranilate isomerase n=1 Tax=unclassified Campylobacter TaxID=2593542 RepID=UPI003D32AB52